MANLLTQDQVDRPQGAGFEGKGPAVDLPSMGAETQPAELVVPVGRQAEPTVTPSAAGNNNWSQIQDALSQGYSRQEVSSYLQKNLGLSPDDADKQLIDSVKDKISTAKASGYNDAEIKDFLITNRYDGAVIDSAMKASAIPTPWKKYEWDPNTPAENAQDISDLYSSIYGKYSTMGKQVVGVFDEQTGIEARREINQLNSSIADRLVKEGIDAYINPASGDVMMRDENGMEQEVDSSFVNSIYNSKSEIGGALAGAYAGLKAGSKAPLRVKPFTMVGGTIAGSMVGAAVGKAADMTVNAAILKEDLEAKLYMTQMQEAAIFDGVASVLGAAAFKGAASGAKQIMKAYDFAVAGNSVGAYKALLDNMQISDAQAKELVAQWEALNNTKARGKNFEEQAIGVIASTQQGAEGYVKYAAATDPKLASSVISVIDERAKGVQKAIDNVTDDNVGRFVREDLATYKKDVQDYYGFVKQEGADAINGTDFRFDLDKLAIQPVMENIGKKISNPIMRERFVAYAARVESASANRTFEGLVDLRQAVNDFKYSKSGLTTPDLEAINSVINRIDSQIGKAVKEYMPTNGKQWTENFNKAKVEYAKMKQVEASVLYKYITKKGSTEAGIQRALSKYATNKDVDAEIFNNVVEKLSPATRAKVEGAAIKNLTNKYTLGESTDMQAVHFPALAQELKGLNIETNEGRNLVKAIDDMAKVFRNDVNLSRVSGNIAVPKFQSYLTTDPIIRAKYEIASSVFNAVKRYVPGRQANNLALLNKVQKLLEDPLHAKTADQLVNAMPKEQQEAMRSLVKELQIQAAKTPQKKSDWLNMYKQSSSGKATVTNGALGKGVYLVDSVKNPNPAATVIKREVNLSRMATLEDISNIVGREVTEKDIRNLPDLTKQLVDKGFLGIKVEGKAMLFPETTLGTRTVKSMPVKQTAAKAAEEDKVFYRGVDGDYADKEFTFWTDRKDQADAYSKGSALTNTGKNPKVLERKMSGGKGRDINDAIEEAIMNGDDPDEIAIEIMNKEGLDWAEFMHPSTNGEDHLVRVVRKKSK